MRGFAQAAGNVVLRPAPSSKSDLSTPFSSHSRHARAAHGAAPGSDSARLRRQTASGDVILTEAGGLAGTVEARVTREYTAAPAGGSAAAIYRSGASTFNPRSATGVQHVSEHGFDRLISLPSRAELERIERAAATPSH